MKDNEDCDLRRSDKNNIFSLIHNAICLIQSKLGKASLRHRGKAMPAGCRLAYLLLRRKYAIIRSWECPSSGQEGFRFCDDIVIFVVNILRFCTQVVV